MNYRYEGTLRSNSKIIHVWEKAKGNGGCKRESIKKRHRENEKSWKIN